MTSVPSSAILYLDDMEGGKKGSLKMNVRERKNKGSTVYEYYFMYRGVRYNHSGYTTKKKAEKAGEAKKAEVIAIDKFGAEHLVKMKSLNDVYKEFILTASKYYQPNTVESIKNAWKHVNRTIGRILITEINYKMLERFFNGLSCNGLESNRLIKFSMQIVFDYAMKCDYVYKNPVKLIKVTGITRKKDREVITYEEFKKITNELDQTDSFSKLATSIAIKIGYYTGGRVGEVLALTKSDFDLVNNTVSYNKKLEYQQIKKSELFVSNTMKTESSKAIIPIPQVLVDELKKWFNINHYELVVCDKKGQYVLPRTIAFHANPIAKRLGFDFRFHMLRHSYASNLVGQGIDVKVAQELLRHANYSTTLDIYTHISNERLKSAVDQIFDKNESELRTNYVLSNSPIKKAFI